VVVSGAVVVLATGSAHAGRESTVCQGLALLAPSPASLTCARVAVDIVVTALSGIVTATSGAVTVAESRVEHGLALGAPSPLVLAISGSRGSVGEEAVVATTVGMTATSSASTSVQTSEEESLALIAPAPAPLSRHFRER
jgi:hypothetical protein